MDMVHVFGFLVVMGEFSAIIVLSSPMIFCCFSSSMFLSAVVYEY